MPASDVAKVEELTFDELRARMSRAGRTAAWRNAGLWALDVVEDELDPKWAAAVASKLSDGDPRELTLSAFHIVAYVELLELALRLVLLRNVSGFAKARRALARDPRRDQLAHARVQLEVAGLALRTGSGLSLEPTRQGHRPADVAFEAAGREIVVETRAVLTSDAWREQNRQTDLVFERIHAIERRHQVRCEGTLNELPTGQQADELLRALEERARLLAAGLIAPALRIPGITLEIVPASKRPAGELRGPEMVGDSWSRIAPRIVDKAAKAVESGATWLRLDALEGLFQVTGWAAMPLTEKLEALAELARPHLGGLEGLVISSGALLAQGMFTDEDVVHPDESCALRRQLPGARVRETLIVPASSHHDSQRATWHDLYAKEPTWLEWALVRCGQRSPAEIFA
jgi:hypothetical protein